MTDHQNTTIDPMDSTLITDADLPEEDDGEERIALDPGEFGHEATSQTADQELPDGYIMDGNALAKLVDGPLPSSFILAGKDSKGNEYYYVPRIGLRYAAIGLFKDRLSSEILSHDTLEAHSGRYAKDSRIHDYARVCVRMTMRLTVKGDGGRTWVHDSIGIGYGLASTAKYGHRFLSEAYRFAFKSAQSDAFVNGLQNYGTCFLLARDHEGKLQQIRHQEKAQEHKRQELAQRGNKDPGAASEPEKASPENHHLDLGARGRATLEEEAARQAADAFQSNAKPRPSRILRQLHEKTASAGTDGSGNAAIGVTSGLEAQCEKKIAGPRPTPSTQEPGETQDDDGLPVITPPEEARLDKHAAKAEAADADADDHYEHAVQAETENAAGKVEEAQDHPGDGSEQDHSLQLPSYERSQPPPAEQEPETPGHMPDAQAPAEPEAIKESSEQEADTAREALATPAPTPTAAPAKAEAKAEDDLPGKSGGGSEVDAGEANPGNTASNETDAARADGSKAKADIAEPKPKPAVGIGVDYLSNGQLADPSAFASSLVDAIQKAASTEEVAQLNEAHAADLAQLPSITRHFIKRQTKERLNELIGTNLKSA